jgi:hypothetical protein
MAFHRRGDTAFDDDDDWEAKYRYREYITLRDDLFDLLGIELDNDHLFYEEAHYRAHSSDEDSNDE